MIDDRDALPLQERRRSVVDLDERLRALETKFDVFSASVTSFNTAVQTLSTTVAALDTKVDRLSAAYAETTGNMRLLFLLFGVDLSNPESVAKAMSVRLKMRDLQRLVLVLLGSGGLAALGIALIDFYSWFQRARGQ